MTKKTFIHRIIWKVIVIILFTKSVHLFLLHTIHSARRLRLLHYTTIHTLYTYFGGFLLFRSLVTVTEI